MRKKLTVVCITSLSYTGTTWINTVLGCHENAFALGPSNRIIDLLGKNSSKDACRVHPGNCQFWDEFLKIYDKNKNFYIQLADFSGKNFIIINNPIPNTNAFTDFKHKNIELKKINIVRDGRAVCSSAMKHIKDKDYLEILTEWFAPSAANLFWDKECPDVLCIRYEDTMKEKISFIKKAGAFIGLDYPENAYEFWKFDHHLAAGNSGLIGQIRAFHSKEKGELKESGDFLPAYDTPNETWKEKLSPSQLFLFEYYCGKINQGWGYEPSKFTIEEFKEFSGLVDLNLAESIENRHSAAKDPKKPSQFKKKMKQLFLNTFKAR